MAKTVVLCSTFKFIDFYSSIRAIFVSLFGYITLSSIYTYADDDCYRDDWIAKPWIYDPSAKQFKGIPNTLGPGISSTSLNV